MKKAKAKPKEMAQTLGLTGPNVIEQAQQATKKFEPEQIAWFAISDIWAKIRVISYDLKTKFYEAEILDSNIYRRGDISTFRNEYVQSNIPESYMKR